MRLRLAFAAFVAVLAAAPAHAAVERQSDAGFVIRHLADVSATPGEVWDVLVKPSEWWNGEHTYTADAGNLSLDTRAGGCFCEILPNEDSPRASPRGSVEHMRVVYIEKDRALRLSGALGPLQSEALNGTLTFMLKPQGDGTRILVEYVVGGYMRLPAGPISGAVDQVIGGQLASLAGKFGPVALLEPEAAPGNDGAGDDAVVEEPIADEPAAEEPEADEGDERDGSDEFDKAFEGR
ncbi:hypothetical protein GCM10011371_12190 [Novosphingobium marinum]|uniref:Polyketide cyclase n=1 Tax=Novosphingobium marinum TaxID=1514948 RepID=A0A7Z0BUL7_9SPHN|nr:SRPBCC family protein [Novosphingobium marinum]NYH95328.1 hypothetical protein [Novosphingobium marinum]GGC26193.1 hypothetical protein GCM10011371_12190 [Novosphingobium marinum]